MLYLIFNSILSIRAASMCYVLVALFFAMLATIFSMFIHLNLGYSSESILNIFYIVIENHSIIRIIFIVLPAFIGVAGKSLLRTYASALIYLCVCLVIILDLCVGIIIFIYLTKFLMDLFGYFLICDAHAEGWGSFFGRFNYFSFLHNALGSDWFRQHPDSYLQDNGTGHNPYGGWAPTYAELSAALSHFAEGSEVVKKHLTDIYLKELSVQSGLSLEFIKSLYVEMEPIDLNYDYFPHSKGFIFHSQFQQLFYLQLNDSLSVDLLLNIPESTQFPETNENNLQNKLKLLHHLQREYKTYIESAGYVGI